MPDRTPSYATHLFHALRAVHGEEHARERLADVAEVVKQLHFTPEQTRALYMHLQIAAYFFYPRRFEKRLLQGDLKDGLPKGLEVFKELEAALRRFDRWYRQLFGPTAPASVYTEHIDALLRAMRDDAFMATPSNKRGRGMPKNPDAARALSRLRELGVKRAKAIELLQLIGVKDTYRKNDEADF